MQMLYDKCPNCLREYHGSGEPCAFCGFDLSGYQSNPQHLKPFTVLQNKYFIGRVIDTDAFGITYIGWDMNLTTYVTVKEYFPPNMASRNIQESTESSDVIPFPDKEEMFAEGLRIYAEEARNLTKFYDMQGMSSVKNLFYENNTAYVVKEYDGAGVSNVNNNQFEASSDSTKKQGINKIAAVSIICVFVVLIAILIWAIVSKNNEKKSDDESDTEISETTTEEIETTEEPTTEVTTEATTEATTEEKVVNFPGSWTDNKMMIGDTVYNFPMTYDTWANNGWSTDMTDIMVNSGEVRDILCYNDKMQCSIYVINYTDETTTFDKCHVVGFRFFNSYHKTGADEIITFPGDIVIHTVEMEDSSSIKDTLDVYGEVYNRSESEYVCQYEYRTENFSRIVLRSDGEGKLYTVLYMCMDTPSDAILQNGATVEVLSTTENYIAPDNTTDRFDGIFCIDGVNYKIGTPITEFLANGWSLECEDELLEPNHGYEGILRKGDSWFEVIFSNSTVFYSDITQGQVTGMNFTTEGLNGMDVTLPGGLKLGMTQDVYVNLYSDIENFIDGSEDNRKKQTVKNPIYTGLIEIIAFSSLDDTEEGVYYIDEYSYNYSESTTDGDVENKEYIQGIMVE